MGNSNGHELEWVYADVVCDLFHAGHVEFFKQARALGQRLVVGLVSDHDVSSYKQAPVMTFEERYAVVNACRHVDRVLETPPPLHCTCEFLDKIGAAFCCHGDDMSADQLRFWYADLIPQGRLKTVRYTQTISTRQIRQRVLERGRS